jgi:2-succinyl-6-hydroxy-2,4-cyclohexadiene-1-carboxylate synthase
MSGRSEIPGEVRTARASDGARLEYEVVGSGPPLVMLHGILASRFAFSRQRAEFAQKFRLILLSARGHDGSEGRLPQNYGVGSSDVDDLCTVLAAEGLERISLLGHSSGGATGFVFACRHPQRVARAVLIEPTLLALLPPADRAEIATNFEAVVAAAKNAGPEAAVRAFIAFAGGEAWRRLDAEQQATRVHAMAACAPLVGPHVRGLLDLAVTETDVSALRPPALFMYGADSFPFEGSIANRFRALRPDLRVMTVEKAGHNVHRDRPDIVNTAALAFLAE